MKQPANTDCYQVLWLQLVDEGRKEALCGEGAVHARTAVLPFLVGSEFPDVYFEFPLVGKPFLDVTLLYGDLEPGLHVDSAAAEGTDAMLDWYAAARAQHPDISCGFELDAHEPALPRAAIHFQPRAHLELVEPFCQAAGEPDKAQMYLDLAARMPKGWDLSFFGMFRGRPGSPLRVCGYLGRSIVQEYAEIPARLAAVFDELGFTAYDDAMLAQVAELMSTAPGKCDFQFDAYPDGSLGSTFAIDVQFHIEHPAAVRASFESGPIARMFGKLQEWGAADERWHLAAGAAFARGVPVELEDGGRGKCSFTLLPQWAKARWRDGVLQPAKLYYLGNSGIL